MTEMVTLRCPEGAYDYPISFGVRSFYPYRVDIYSEDTREFGGPWNVDIPIDIAAHFVQRGFILMSEDQRGEVPETVRMRSLTGGGCVWGDPSQTYEPDASGVVTVPYAALTDLGFHGFVVVPDEAPAEETKAAPSQRSGPPKPDPQQEPDEPEHRVDPRGGRNVPRR